MEEAIQTTITAIMNMLAAEPANINDNERQHLDEIKCALEVFQEDISHIKGANFSSWDNCTHDKMTDLRNAFMSFECIVNMPTGFFKMGLNRDRAGNYIRPRIMNVEARTCQTLGAWNSGFKGNRMKIYLRPLYQKMRLEDVQLMIDKGYFPS
jgi:hypothetical protein